MKPTWDVFCYVERKRLEGKEGLLGWKNLEDDKTSLICGRRIFEMLLMVLIASFKTCGAHFYLANANCRERGGRARAPRHLNFKTIIYSEYLYNIMLVGLKVIK